MANTQSKIQRTFKLTWMADPGKVAVMDVAVRDRQRALLRRLSKVNEEVTSAYSVDILIDSLNRALGSGADGDGVRLRRVMIDTVLLAELISSALCPDHNLAGGIYELVRHEHEWRDWNSAHQPLRCLRNAVLHPGQIRPAHDTDATHLGSAVDALRLYLDGNRPDLANELCGSPAALFTVDFVDWALMQLQRAGMVSARTAKVGWT